MSARAACGLIFTLVRPAGIVLALCTSAGAQYSVPPPGPTPLPANYRQMAAFALNDTLRDKIAAGFAEGSQPRASAAPQPGEWVMCVRSAADGPPLYFVLFFSDGKVETVRRAVAIDRCQTASYSPLPPARIAGAATAGKKRRTPR
jgi:hypothetical protein